MKTDKNKKCYIVKIIIVGNQAVGKTNLVTRYVKGEFNNDYIVTLGMDFLTCNIKYKNKIIKLRLWDTAGQERFKSVTRGYYSNSCCALIVYDVTDQSSFDSVKQWIEDSQTYGSKDIHLVLVGNKIDLKDQRKISTEDGQNLATQYGMDFYESSASTGENINNIFEGICKYVNHKIDKGEYDLEDPSTGVTNSELEENIKIHKTMSIVEDMNSNKTDNKARSCCCG